MKRIRSAALAILAVAAALLATSGAAAQDDAAALVIEFLRDQDKEIRALAYEQVRSDLPGEEATSRFAGVLPELPADAQVGLLSALQGRGDPAAAPAIRSLLRESESQAVRVAAVKALGAVGKAEDHALLIDLLADASAEVQEAARRGLILLAGDEASEAIAERMTAAPAGLKVALIEILTTRRARSTIPAILNAATSDQAEVRQAAMQSLGAMAGPEHIGGMVQGVLRAEPGRERAAAERAVADVSHRMENTAEQAEPVLAAMETLAPPRRVELLNTLGRIGGPEARRELELVLADKKHRTAAIVALSNWPDGSVAFRLLEIARTDEDQANRRRALDGLIRVAPLPDERSDQLRLDLLRTAMAMSQTEEDRLRVLDRAKAVRTVESLRFVRPYLQQEGYAEQAALTIVELAHHSSLRESHREEFHAALDEVLAISQDATVLDRARRYKAGQTWVRPT